MAEKSDHLPGKFFDRRKIARNEQDVFQSEIVSVRLKKYFYVLRPVLACDWIRQTNSFPPMEFEKLVDSQVTDEKIRREIDELLKRKIAGDEMKEEPKIEILNEFLEEKIEFYSDFAAKIETGEKPPTEMLDALFKETLFEVWK